MGTSVNSDTFFDFARGCLIDCTNPMNNHSDEVVQLFHEACIPIFLLYSPDLYTAKVCFCYVKSYSANHDTRIPDPTCIVTAPFLENSVKIVDRTLMIKLD